MSLADLSVCQGCGNHIGPGGMGRCGACENPLPLSWLELLRLGRLARKKWPHGLLTELVHRQNFCPTLYVTGDVSLAFSGNTPEKRRALRLLKDSAELANLYDRSQAQRGTNRRAVRI